MSKKAPTSRPFARWPARDQHLWHAATHKGDFLDPDGKAAHWSDATRIQVEKVMANGSSILKPKACFLAEVMSVPWSVSMRTSFAHI